MEVAQLVKFVPYLHEDQCLALEPTKKKKKAMCGGRYLHHQRGGKRESRVPGACWLATHTYLVGYRPCVETIKTEKPKQGVPVEVHLRLTSGLHMAMHVNTYTHIHTHTMRERERQIFISGLKENNNLREE